MAKPMKRANGTGAITKVSGRRRKPYQVMITVGWSNEGKQIRKSLGYFETMDKATVALANYMRIHMTFQAARLHSVMFTKSGATKSFRP